MHHKRSLVLTLIAIAAAHAAHAACPVGSTVTLASSSTKRLTDVDIQAKINSLPAGTVNLTGSFNIARELVLKSCVNLATPSTTSTLAVLNWTGGNGRMASATNANDIKLSRLKLVGRGLVLQGNNITVDGLQFLNPSRPDPVNEPDLYVVKLIGGTGATVTNSTFTIDAGRTDLRALSSTAVIGWGNEKANISSNQFTGISSGVHLFTPTNSVVSKNTGRDLSWAGIEIQGDADNTYANTISGNSFYNWLADKGFGYSIAGGKGYSVSGNIAVRKGDNTLACSTAKPAGTNEYGPWGMEFTGVNSTASQNTLCGFDTGIFVGIAGQGTFTGADTTQVNGNTVTNSNVAVMIGMTLGNAGATKSVNVSGNTLNNARLAGVADQTWWNESPHYQLGTAAQISALSISSNIINRAATDADAGATYRAITVHPLKVASGLSVKSNTIKLTATPPAGFNFQGIVFDAYRDDYGNAVGQSSFAGSVISGNAISSAVLGWGTGIVGGANAGVSFATNRFTGLQQAIQGNLSASTVSGNTCSNVNVTTGCY